MFLIFRRRKSMSAFAAFLISGYLLTSNAVAQTASAANTPPPGGAAVSSEEMVKAEKPKRKVPTGLLDLKGFKYPVYIYVPEGLELDKKYPLLFIVPSDTDSVEKQLEYILPVAKSLECFVLATDNIFPKETPFEIDRWLLKIKGEITPRFPIDASKVYAIGRNSGAQYAAYLITAYPEEFSGAALLGEAWEGPFTQLLKVRVSAGEQMPVVAAFTADQQDKKLKNEKWVMEYQQKGYPVQVMEPPAGQNLDSPEFKVAILEWLDQKGQAWKLIREQENKTFKQRFKQGVKEFFEV